MRKVLALAVAGLFTFGIGVGLVDGEHGAASAIEADDASITTLDVPVGTSTNHLVWSTTKTGDIAFRIVFDVNSGLQSCLFVVSAAGRVGPSPVQTYLGHDKIGRTWTALQFPHPISAHASSLAVVLPASPTGFWAAQHVHQIAMSGEEPWIYAGFNLLGWNNPFTNGKSLIFDLECLGSFTVTEIQAGKELVGFSPAWMRGGVGATAPLVTANLADSATRVFSEPTVHLRYRTEDFAAGGALRVTTPAGAVAYPLFGDDEVFVSGPDPGTWGATLVRASVGPQAGVGVIVGVRPVASLDAGTLL